MSLTEILDRTRAKEVICALDQMDLQSVDKRLVGKVGDEQYVRDLKLETMRFLAISASTNESTAPSKKVDEYWHEMVLNTPLYETLSENIGAFIHHLPSDKPENEAYRRTIAAYDALFGAPDPRFWKTGDAADCSSFCSSGACQANCRDAR